MVYIGFRWKTNCITLPLIVTGLFVKLFIYFNWFSDFNLLINHIEFVMLGWRFAMFQLVIWIHYNPTS